MKRSAIRRRCGLRFGAMLLTAGALLPGSGCGFLGRELEVLFRPEANPFLIRDSFLVDVFGLRLIRILQNLA